MLAKHRPGFSPNHLLANATARDFPRREQIAPRHSRFSRRMVLLGRVRERSLQREPRRRSPGVPTQATAGRSVSFPVGPSTMSRVLWFPAFREVAPSGAVPGSAVPCAELAPSLYSLHSPPPIILLCQSVYLRKIAVHVPLLLGIFTSVSALFFTSVSRSLTCVSCSFLLSLSC